MAVGKGCQTVYPTEAALSGANILAVMVFNCIVAVSNIFANCFLVHALKKINQHRTLSNKLIICLCLSDCAIGLCLQPLISLLMVNAYRNSVSCTLELTIQALGFGLCHFSGVMLAIISLDRYIHIRHASKYSRIMTTQRAAMLVVGNFMLTIVVAAASVIASQRADFFLFGLAMASADSLIVVSIWIVYFLVYRSIKKHVNRMEGQRVRGQQKGSSTARADTVLAKTMILIMTSQLSCYFPYFIVITIRAYKGFNDTESSGALDALLWWSSNLVYLNSCINALILIFRNPKIRRIYFSSFDKTSDSDIAFESRLKTPTLTEFDKTTSANASL